MQTGSSDLFSLAERKLDWLEDRQRVLARNVANANTPNFQPSDERPFAAALSSFMVTPVQTDAMHLPGTVGDSGTIKVAGHERSPDGNRVSVEEEMTKVAETDNQQRLVTNIYSKYMAMFSTALGKG
ncbi:flagellar basal body rod protein FlgB [Lichenicoccus sp.]|uniref:flagellar basal body rod protein FlgB n=1 Tax=Lichenicoccus sp. TaxID=2781899 RepID=UPI003D0B2A58